MEGASETSPPSPHFRISCSEVPQELLHKSAAKQYFSQFGRIQRLVFRPRSKICIVEYATEKGMQRALAKAGEYYGQTFKVQRDFKQTVRKKQVKKEEDPDWTQDPDVQKELETMKGAAEVTKDYLLRSRDMQVDESPTATPKAKLVKQKIKKSLLMNVTAESVKPKKIMRKTWKGNSSDQNLPTEQMELIKIIKQSAATAEEKFKILEARDKLIRLRTKKHTDLAKAKVTVGTCPDMCPEKERLMRETQHQISLYEQEAGGKGMNPSLAVKQYSRSSADQEVPLPHELRPVQVLRMTMNYLMAKIMNLCDSMDVNFAEWYHFLWDRTRGIRKDITQQELCSEEAVELVEQCARFHIHCSARLVAEDPSVFDQKINTENLTKCLQTLKYMYHDLELKGVHCKNEAEFRAYIILLNLNDGNFMWEVQQLRPEIQKSREVRFALQVYSALDKNNYVRFFKLVHSTSYLNACILLRYFVQVRLSALKVLLKCFSPRQPYKSYPLSELTEILAFENVESTVDFLIYHGLVLSEDRTQVILDRRLFGMPEYPYAIDRAINVIESKRTCSVGEVVCGGRLTLSLFENHVPHNSFDASGRLDITDILTDLNITLQDDVEEAKDETDEAPKTSNFSFLEGRETTERSRSPMMSENKTTASTTGMFAAASESIFGKAKGESIFGTTENTPFRQFKFVAPETPQSKSIFGLQAQQAEEPAQQTVEEPPKLFTFKTVDKREETKEPSSEFELQQTVEEPSPPTPPQPDVSQILKQKFEEEQKQREEEEARKRELLAQQKMEEQRKQKLLEERERKRQEELEKKKKQLVLERKKQEEIGLAVAVTMENLLVSVEENVRCEKLQEIARRVSNRRARKFVKMWREAVAARRKEHGLGFGCAWSALRSSKEVAKQLETASQNLVMRDMKTYLLGKSTEIPIPKPPNIEKIKIHETCYSFLLGSLSKHQIKFPTELFWKVTISLPDASELTNNRLNDVLNACIGWKQNHGATFVLEQKKTSNQDVTYCIERKEGLKACRTDSNAIIFISENFTEILRKRMYNTLVHYGRNAKVPIVLILQHAPTKANDGQIQLLQVRGLLDIYKVLHNKFTSTNLTELIKEALRFLAQNPTKPPPLELDTLRSFLSQYLAGDIWKRISGLAKWNSSYRDCLKSPEIAMKIYNDNLDKLKAIVFDQNRLEFASFPAVFADCLLSELPEYLPYDYKYFPKFWNSGKYDNYLKSTLNNFYICDYTFAWPPENECVLERDIFAYCEKNFQRPQKAFYKLMSVVLKDVDPESNFEDLKNFLWTDLVETIALEKIAETNFALTDPEFSKSVFNQLFVVYDSELLSKHCACTWFYVNYPPIREKVKELMVKNETRKETRKRKASERLSLELDIDLDEMLNHVTQRFVEDREKDLQRRKDMREIKSLMSDLKESMDIQKKINATLQNRLKHALENC